MVHQSGIITQHLSSIVIFVALFINLRTGALAGSQLIWTGSTLTGAGYLVWDTVMIRRINRHHAFNRKYLILYHARNAK